ncbi:unnamed protein product [Arabis nemorensis]|uniref:Protein kinase domain-containing protein n=1 Tax=Arabis nemorensis TaxID=586526 RepID=A0A565CU65_9BRAS|nr:unnamed protein product [Arabis nemorensis]
MVIGESFGKVVRGYINPKTLSPAKEGAVKRFYLANEQALQEWLYYHPSLVKLIGYGMLFVVSEYFPNGSLEGYIYRETRPRPLSRLKISTGAAHCLAFLHSRKKARLYRRYLTASKILLHIGKSHMPGDVYSFGVILLKILTGFGKQRIIVAIRALPNDKENIKDMIDPDLENSYPLEQGMRMCEVIKQCLDEDPKKRPSMQQVLDDLNAIAQI